MNIQSGAMPESPLDAQMSDRQGIAPRALSPTRPLYWSVRRELWENRSIYIAPVAVAAVYMVGFLISQRRLPRSIRGLPELDLSHQQVELAMPYSHAAMLLMAIAFIVGVFYSLDALHGERRDRSILFWKSLPVSDLTTVLAKAVIPLVVLPLLVFVIAVALQLVMRLLGTAVLLMSGVGAAPLWTQLPLFQLELVLAYALTVIALWHAPLYGWLLLVSAWARRATFLWAVLPPLVIAVFERIAFHSSHIGSLLLNRLIGFAPNAFAFRTPDGGRLDPHFILPAQLTPGRFLSSPGLWIGLVIAVAFLAAAVRLRRYREPI